MRCLELYDRLSPGENKVRNQEKPIAHNLSHRLWLLVTILGMGSVLPQVRSEDQPARRAKAVSAATSLEGQQIFAASCAGCHGLDGRGSERAPNIAQSREAQRLSDAGLFRIIQKGVPGSGMPAFRPLGASGIKSVVSYLRTLQSRNKAATLPGDPQRGKSLFFGKGGCFECHMLSGQGGFMAADLTGYARIHSLEEIRDVIIDPGSNQSSRENAAVAVTRSGQKYAGVARNEDNFSVQLQSVDGSFHFLMKSDLERLESRAQSLMPPDYGSRLSPRELDDLVGFLISSARAGKSEPASGDED